MTRHGVGGGSGPSGGGSTGAPPRLSAPAGEVVPQWAPGDLVDRACFACGHGACASVCARPDGLEVARCGRCGALYLPRVPSAEAIARFYERYAEEKAYLAARPARRPGLLRRLVLRVLHPPAVSAPAEVLVRTGGVAGRTVVEFGPGGSGGLLHEVRRLGARAVAVEIDRVAAARLRGAGIEVHESASGLAAVADVVVASMVLEHVADPRALIAEMARVARPRARLLASVPNAGQSCAVGSAWVGFRVDLEHLNYFDAALLSALLAEAGFLVECLWESAQPVLPDYLAMSDRRTFLAEVRRRLGRAAVASPDPLAAGGFQLTVLARLEEGGR